MLWEQSFLSEFPLKKIYEKRNKVQNKFVVIEAIDKVLRVYIMSVQQVQEVV